MKSKTSKSVDAYLLSQPDNIRPLLEELRTFIISLLPDTAEEVISYSMPAYRYKGMLVGFAGAKNHVGFYTWNGHTVSDFAEALKNYSTSKSAIRLPLNNPLPKPLLKKIIKTRISENEAKHQI